MWWAFAPEHSSSYTLRAGDGPEEEDTVSYRRGEWLNIHLRVKTRDMKYIGLLLYAVDASETKVGEWEQVDNLRINYFPFKGKPLLHKD